MSLQATPVKPRKDEASSTDTLEKQIAALSSRLQAIEQQRDEQTEVIKKQAQDIADLKRLYEESQAQRTQEQKETFTLRALVEAQQQELRSSRRQSNSTLSARASIGSRGIGGSASEACLTRAAEKVLSERAAAEREERPPSVRERPSERERPVEKPPQPPRTSNGMLSMPEAKAIDTNQILSKAAAAATAVPSAPALRKDSSRDASAQASREASTQVSRLVSASTIPLSDDGPVGLSIPDPANGEGDRIDKCIRAFFRQHPDFRIGVSKERPGWYAFGKPISKRVFMKVVGSHVVVRCGGGYTECHRWLEEYRLEMLESEQLLEGAEKVRKASIAKGRRTARSYSPQRQRAL